jgi:hypothetical protein
MIVRGPEDLAEARKRVERWAEAFAKAKAVFSPGQYEEYERVCRPIFQDIEQGIQNYEGTLKRK